MAHQHPVELDRYLISRLPNLAGKRVLDVGCGKGALGYLLRSQPGGDRAHLVGVDVHEPYLDFCRRFNVYDELYLSDIAKLDLEPFDIALACDVLEHIPRPESDHVLDEIEALTRDRVFVSTPNGPDLRGSVHGVESEAHVSVWRISDFTDRGYQVRGTGNRLYKGRRAGPWTLALSYMTTPLAVRFPVVGCALFAMKVM